MDPGHPGASKRYRLELKTSVAQDLTALGQGEQKQEFSNTAFVTVTATDSAGGQTVTVVLDSLVPGEGSPIPAEAAKGAAGHDVALASGSRTAKVADLKLEGENPVASAHRAGAAAILLPPMKPGTREGQVWTDTTETRQ